MFPKFDQRTAGNVTFLLPYLFITALYERLILDNSAPKWTTFAILVAVCSSSVSGSYLKANQTQMDLYSFQPSQAPVHTRGNI